MEISLENLYVDLRAKKVKTAEVSGSDLIKRRRQQTVKKLCCIPAKCHAYSMTVTHEDRKLQSHAYSGLYSNNFLAPGRNV